MLRCRWYSVRWYDLDPGVVNPESDMKRCGLDCTIHSWLLPEKLLSALLLLQPQIFDSFIKSCYILQSLEKGSGHMNQRWDNCRGKKLPWVYEVDSVQHSPFDLLGTWQILCCLSFTQTGGNCPQDLIKCMTFLLCFFWTPLHCFFPLQLQPHLFSADAILS